MKLDEAIQEKIKSDFLTGRFSKAALAAKYNCTKWQIRQLLLGVSSGAICKVCGPRSQGRIPFIVHRGVFSRTNGNIKHVFVAAIR